HGQRRESVPHDRRGRGGQRPVLPIFHRHRSRGDLDPAGGDRERAFRGQGQRHFQRHGLDGRHQQRGSRSRQSRRDADGRPMQLAVPLPRGRPHHHLRLQPAPLATGIADAGAIVLATGRGAVRLFRAAVLGLGVLLAGCAGVTGRASTGTGGAGGTARPPTDASAGGVAGRPVLGSGGARDAGSAVVDSGPAPITDFPPDPIIDTGAPSNAPTLFTTAPRTSGAPCILSPEPGTLMPRNWLRPLFQYTRSADENLFEITLTVAAFAHPLVIYTTAMSYTLPAGIWDGLRVSVNDQPIAVTVRALTLSGTDTVQNPPSPPATADFTIAPVDAPGKIVYWALPSGGGDGILRGFGVGEEGVEDVLTSSLLVSPAINAAQNDGCLGCHSATPDGLSVGFQLGPHDNGSPHTFYDSIAEIGGATVGQKPAYVTDG